MLNRDYTGNTGFQFDRECCSGFNSINTIGVYPENKIEKALNCPQNSDKWVQFFVPEIVDIPTQKPDIEEIVEVNSCVQIISQRVVRTPEVIGYTNSDGIFIPGDTIDNAECTRLTGKKLIVEGIINQKIIYTALVANQALHSASFAIPFSVFIIVDKDTQLSQSFKITAYIEDIFACKLSERSVFKNTTIFIKATKVC